jgi:hypothetical protein
MSQEVAMDEEIIAGSTLRQMALRGQQANVLACRIRQPKEGDMAQREQKGNREAKKPKKKKTKTIAAAPSQKGTAARWQPSVGSDKRK